MAARWSARLPLYEALRQAYPPHLSGWHRRQFADGRITLSLYFGTASEALADLEQRQALPIDHWLLDGDARIETLKLVSTFIDEKLPVQ